jgi:uncharacterized repeat protein (TIGR01451 family)
MKTRKQFLQILAVAGLLAGMLFGALGIRPAAAATVLGPGDIAIVGFNFQNDYFSFVLLVDIEAGTQIRFTDAGWIGTGFFNGEGAVTYTAPMNLDAGNVITYSGPDANFEVTVEGPFTLAGGIAFTNAGDQLLAFQGPYATPVFLYALNNDDAGWTTSNPNAQKTGLPPGLTDGYTAISLGGSEWSGVYNGPFSGTREELLAAISDPNNWTYPSGGVTYPTGPFVVDPGYPEVVSTTPESDAVNVLRFDPILIQFDEDVEVDEGWFEIDCDLSDIHTASVSGGPQEYTLEPDVPFVLDDVCTVTVQSDLVTDFDDTPKNMLEDYEWSFSVLESEDLNVGFSSNTPVLIGEWAEFTNTTTGDGSISYSWDFEDGSEISTDTDPQHLFEFPGTYQVTLTAFNEHGQDRVTHPFVVLSGPLTVDKAVYPQTGVPLGGEVTYTIIIENTGGAVAQNVVLSDTLPEGLSFVVQVSGPDLTWDVDANELSWTGDVTAGERVEFGFTALLDDDEAWYGATIRNTVYITSESSGSDTFYADLTVEPQPLVVSFTSNTPVVLGETAFFTNTTTGQGPVTYVWDFGDGSPSSTAAHPEHEYAATGTYTVTLTATNPHDEDSYSANFVVLTAPSIYVEKSVSPNEDIALGDEVEYTVVIENTGQGLANGVELSDTLPDGVSFVGQTVGPDLVLAGNQLSWMDDLAGGEQVVFVFTALVEDDPALYSQTITNTAYVTSQDAGEDMSSAAFTVMPSPASLSISKEVDAVEPVELGGQVTYTITLSNSGQSDAGSISLVDVLPAGLVDVELAVGSEGEYDPDTHTLTWTGSVPGADEIVIAFTATVDEVAGLYGTEILNTASFEWGDISGSDTATITVVPSPALLTISKSVTPDQKVALGGQVTYTILMTNHGDTEAMNVVMTDILPVPLTVLSVQGGGTANGNTVSWTGSILGNSSKTIVFTASLSSSPSLFGQTISNTVAFTSANAGDGQTSVSFRVTDMPKVYLPVVTNP